MRGEALGVGERRRRGAEVREGGGAGAGHDVDRLAEVRHPESGGEACRAPRGEDVGRPRHVVTEGHGGPVPAEDGTGVAHSGQEGAGVRDHELQVFGGGGVGHLQGLLGPLAEDEPAAGPEALRDEATPGRSGHDELQLRLDGGGEVVGPRDEEGEAAGAVLGLGDEVEGEGTHGGAGVGDDHALAGPGQGLHPHVTGHLGLGEGDVHVSGPADDVHGPDRRRAVGESGDRLGAPDPVDLGEAEHVGGGRAHLRDRPVGTCRGGEDDLGDPGDLGGDGGHEDRGRVRCPAAGHVHARPGDGNVDLVHGDAVGFEDPRAVGGFVVRADAGGGTFEGETERWIRGLPCPREFVGGHAELPRCEGDAVETLGELAEGDVASGPDVADDGAHRLERPVPRRGRSGDGRGETTGVRAEIGQGEHGAL